MSSANQSMRSPGAQMPALLIQPPRLVDVPTSGRDGDDAVGHLGRLAHEVDEEAPERLLGGLRALVLAPEVVGHRGRIGHELRRRPVQPPAGGRAQRRLGRVVRRTAPTGPRGRCRACCASCAVLLAVEERAVVGRVALGRQHPALDRVGEDDGRAPRLGVGLAIGVDERAEVVAAEVAERWPAARRRRARRRRPPAARAARRASARSSRWYSSLGIASTRSRSAGRARRASART